MEDPGFSPIELAGLIATRACGFPGELLPGNPAGLGLNTGGAGKSGSLYVTST